MALQFIDEQHKRRTIQSKGFDPERFDVDVNTGNIIPKINTQPPTVTPPPDLTATQPVQQPQPMSPIKSAAIGAATSVLPAAGGLGAAIAAQPIILPIAAATGPAAPLTEIGLSIAAAMGGGAGINYLQNKLMPQSVQQTVAEAQQSNPMSFMGGSLAGQLPVMAANPRGVLEAGKTGAKMVNNLIKPTVAPLGISAAEKANMLNVGVGAAIPAGELVLDAATGKPINPAEAALSIAGGAILNKPSALAGKIFKINPNAGDVKPSVSPEQLKQLQQSVGDKTQTLKDYGPILESQTAQREISRGIIPPGYNVEINAKGPQIPPAVAIENKILSPEIRTKLKPKGDLPERFKQALPKEGIFKELGIKQDVVNVNKSAAESAETMFDRSLPSVRARDRIESGGDNPQGETTFKTGQESIGLPKVKPVEQIKSERESNYKLFSDLMAQGKASEAAKFSSQLGETYYFNRRYSTEKSTGAKAEFPPTEEGKLTAQDKQLLAERRKNFQGLTDSETQLTAETRLRKDAEKAGNEQKLSATKEFFDTFNKVFGPLRNVKQSLDGRLVNKETGKPVRGEIEAVRDGLTSLMSKVNPNIATPDTVPHEFIHGWFTDFKNSPNRYEKTAAVNLERAVEQLPEFKADNQRRIDNGKSPLSPEEYIAETGGYEVFNRAVNLDGNQGTFKQGWKDFLSQVKLKIGKASTEDIQQYVTNRFIKDPSFGETFANKYANVQQADEGEDTTQVINKNQTDNQKPESKINEQGNEQRSETPTQKGQRVDKEIGSGEAPSVKAGEPKEAVATQQESGDRQINNQQSDEVTKSEFKVDKKSADSFEREIIASETSKLEERLDQLKFHIDNLKYGLKSEDVPIEVEKRWLKDYEMQQEFITKELNRRSGNKYQESDEVTKSDKLVNTNQTETPEFKNWFGDSKVVDKEGKPLRVYHGTESSPFYTFKEGFGQARGNALGSGMYFTTSRKSAELFGNNQIHEVFLSLKNPLDLRKPENKKLMWDEKGIYPHIERLRKEGLIDGIIDVSSRGAEYGLDFVVFKPEQIKSATGNSGAFDPKNPDIRYQENSDIEDVTNEIPRPAPQGKTAKDIRSNIEDTLAMPAFRKAGIIKQNLRDLKSRLPIFGSDIDKLSTRAGESGKYIAPAIKEALTKMDEYEGRYYNPSVENIKSLSYKDQTFLIDTLREEHRTNKSLREELPTEELKKAYDIQRDLLKQKQEDQIKAGQPVVEFVRGPRGGYEAVPRDAKVNPFYFPDIAGSKQLDIILNHEGSEAFDILKTDFINHIQDKYSFDRETALELFEDYKGSFSGGPSGGGNSTKFGAVRRAEGVGLPDSWLEADPAVTLRRYWRRVAKDRAWFDAVESDPNNLYILGYSKDSWGNKVTPTKDRISRIPSNETLTGIIDTVQGVNIKQNPKIDAIARIANNLILGPLTGVNDIISALPVVSKFIPSFGDAPKVYLDAITNIGDGIRNAKSTGRIKEKISNLEDIYYPTTETVERLRQLGDGIAKISGREKLEEFSRGIAQAAGESIIKIHRGKAENGNAKSIKFLTELANKSDYKEMSDIQLASRIVDLSQGTYDVRGLPSWMINSQVAPMFRMMKWNVEQLNNLHKHVIIPATQGNYTPLLLSLTAGAIGGFVAKEVRETVSNKKLNIPSLSEIKNSEGSAVDKLHGATYATAAALSYSGVLGFLGEMLKTLGDVSFKNKPNGFNFPAVEVVSDVVDNISDAIQAITQEGENPLEVLPMLTQKLLTNNIQTGRLILNWSKDSDEVETQKQRRDLRVYKQMSGKDYQGQTLPQNVNPYVGMESKKFQKIDDVKELVPEAKRLVKKTIDENRGNPSGLKSGLQKLKSGAVTTFPSIDNAPDEFAKYYRYLVKVYGEKEAKERLKSYNKQRSVNQLRRSLIPSLD